MLLGVDVGGTFTDAALLDEGAVHSAKVPTTPGREYEGVKRAVADGATGKVLASHNGDEPMKAASTTKTMCSLVVLELAKKDPAVLDEEVTFSKLADITEGSTAGIKAGEQRSITVPFPENYAKADLALPTTGRTPQDCVARIRRALAAAAAG